MKIIFYETLFISIFRLIIDTLFVYNFIIKKNTMLSKINIYSNTFCNVVLFL